MKRLVVLIAAIVAAALIVWLASGTTSDEPVTSQAEAPRATPRPAAPPAGFSAEPAPPRDKLPAPASQPEQAKAIAVPPGGVVSGQVVRASDGSPLDGVLVRALADDGKHGPVELAHSSTKAGRFAFGVDVTSRSPSTLTLTWTAPTPRGVKLA